MKLDATTLFIQKAKNKHGDKYNYDLVDYKNSKKKVIIICPKHGEFEQTPNNHLRGASCLKCAREKIAKQKQREASQQFVAKAQKIHGERYSYDLVDYKNSQSKIIILCPNHGAFEQKANNHLNGAGCPSCGKVKQSESRKKRSLKASQQFVAKAQKIHGERYSYDLVEYSRATEEVIIICPKHGEFKQQASTHLSGHGCYECGVEKTQEYNKQQLKEAGQKFIDRAIEVHGDRYNYSLVEYQGARSKVIITCQDHGTFTQDVNNHLNGAGCPSCGKVKQGWSRSTFVAYAKRKYGGKANLYIIKCFDHGETFYKIGITAQSIIDRFKYNQAMPYQYTVLMFISGEASEIYDLEKEVHRQQRVYHYIPNQPFSGSALECFSKLTSLTCELIKSSAYMAEQI